MQTVTNEIARAMAGSSFIRKMFEKGIELKRKYGDDAVCDYSVARSAEGFRRAVQRLRG